MSVPSVVVAQVGARRHYAVPRIYQQAGMLARLYTDICAVKGWPRLANSCWPTRVRPAGVRRLLGRVPYGIPREKITAFSTLGLKIYQRRRRVRSTSDFSDLEVWTGSQLCQHVVNSGLPAVDLVHTFCSGGLELIREAKSRGIRTIVEQTNAPAGVYSRIIDEEHKKYAGFIEHSETNDSWQSWAHREQQEWDAADMVICGSQFVVDGIREVGGPVHKTVVVPSGVEVPARAMPRKIRGKGASVNVLYVGRIDLRKGAHYLIEAARRMKDAHVSFRMCGAELLTPRALQDLPPNLEILGRVPRAEIQRQYEWADVFCLPSLCEGSAMVTYEAMAMGLPVITTPNSGSIVQDGVNGFLFPARDPDAIVAAIEKCRPRLDDANDPFPASPASPPEFSLEAYANRLIAAANQALR